MSCTTLATVRAVDILEPEPAQHSNPFRAPRLGIVSFSARPTLSNITRPSLQGFFWLFPRRYDLSFVEAPLVDARDFHSSWNKLAVVRRSLVIGHHALQQKFDAVIWVNDNVVITSPKPKGKKDLLYDLIHEHLLCKKCTKLVLASRVEPVLSIIFSILRFLPSVDLHRR